MSGVTGRPVLTSATPAAPRHIWSPSRTSANTPGIPAQWTFSMAIFNSVGSSGFFMTSSSDLLQMPQLIWVAHHIDCRDLFVLDFDSGRLEFSIGFQRNETRQSVDETSTNKLRFVFAEPLGQILLELHNGVESQHRLRGCRTLASAVGMNADISRQHPPK